MAVYSAYGGVRGRQHADGVGPCAGRCGDGVVPGMGARHRRPCVQGRQGSRWGAANCKCKAQSRSSAAAQSAGPPSRRAPHGCFRKHLPARTRPRQRPPSRRPPHPTRSIPSLPSLPASGSRFSYDLFRRWSSTSSATAFSQGLHVLPLWLLRRLLMLSVWSAIPAEARRLPRAHRHHFMHLMWQALPARQGSSAQGSSTHRRDRTR